MLTAFLQTLGWRHDRWHLLNGCSIQMKAPNRRYWCSAWSGVLNCCAVLCALHCTAQSPDSKQAPVNVGETTVLCSGDEQYKDQQPDIFDHLCTELMILLLVHCPILHLHITPSIGILAGAQCAVALESFEISLNTKSNTVVVACDDIWSGSLYQSSHQSISC